MCSHYLSSGGRSGHNWLTIVLASQVIARALLLKTLVKVAVWLVIGLIVLYQVRSCRVVRLISGSFGTLRRYRRSLLLSRTLFALYIARSWRGNGTILQAVLILGLSQLLGASRILSLIMGCDCLLCCIIRAWHDISELQRHSRVERGCMMKLMACPRMMEVVVVVCWLRVHCGWSCRQLGVARDPSA